MVLFIVSLHFGLILSSPQDLRVRGEKDAETMQVNFQASLSEIQNSLTSTEAELARTQASLSETNKALSETREALSQNQSELQETLARLEELQASSKEQTQKLEELKRALTERDATFCKCILLMVFPLVFNSTYFHKDCVAL